MNLYPKLIHDALATVRYPGTGKNLIEAEMVEDERVLQRIADILNKFKEYNVVIEGHANNLSNTEEEETATVLNGMPNIPLVPLSKDRAEYVKSRLVKYGVNESRLTTDGKGGRYPVAPSTDRNVSWKNRRVEFILQK